MVKKAKEKEWETFIEMEKNSKKNKKLFHTVLKTMKEREESKPGQIKDNNSKFLTEPRDIIQRWKE